MTRRKARSKPVDELEVADFAVAAVWRFVGDDRDDTAVQPIADPRVSDLERSVVGTRVRLANGRATWAILGNLDPKRPDRNEHFLTVSIESGKTWFHLARYHDADWKKRGPAALARALGLRTKDVFPISYEFQLGRTVISGKIESKPRTNLSRAELIALALD